MKEEEEKEKDWICKEFLCSDLETLDSSYVCAGITHVDPENPQIFCAGLCFHDGEETVTLRWTLPQEVDQIKEALSRIVGVMKELESSARKRMGEYPETHRIGKDKQD